MKKTIIIIILLSVASAACAMQACKCPCGNREADFVDHLKMAGVLSGFLVSPAYMNYMLYADKNMTGLYIYDGILIGSAAAAMFSGELFEGKAREGGITVLLLEAFVVPWGYSCLSMINGIIQNNGEKTGRGALGFFVCPAAAIASTMLMLDCRCKPEKDCPAFMPVIGPEYAGLNCSIKF